MSVKNSLNICLTHCDYTVNGHTPVIHLFGREPQNLLKRYHIQINGFEPFFYVNDDININSNRIKRLEVDNDFPISLDGYKVKKIVTNIPKDVSDLRDNDLKFSKTYQSKVLFPLNFMCCNNIRSGVSIPKKILKVPVDDGNGIPDFIVENYKNIVSNNDIYVEPLVLIFDIEVDNRDGNPSFNEVITESAGNRSRKRPRARYPITMITFKDTYSKFIYTFAWHPNRNGDDIKLRDYDLSYSGEKLSWKVFLFDNEMEMLYKVRDFIIRVNPDIYTGWNVNFDIGYLMARLMEVGIPLNFLSPLGNFKNSDGARMVPRYEGEMVKEWTPVIEGVTILDMLACYRSLTKFDGMKDSYKLDDVGSDELALKKLRYQGTTGDLWFNDFNKCIFYNVRDVEICYEINRKLNIMDFHDTLRRQVGCQFEDTLFTSRIIETEVLRKARSIGRVVPYQEKVKKEKKFQGAVVFDPTIGKHKNVFMLDLKSLYPSIIQTLNISPETRVKKELYTEDELKQFIKSSAGHYYRKDIVGFAKDCLVNMNRQRDKFKACKQAIAYIIDEKNKIDCANGHEIIESMLKILRDNSQRIDADFRNEVVEIVAFRLKEIKFDGKTKDDVLKILKSEKVKHDLTQKAEKAKINTWYGIMGHQGASLYRLEDAESVTLSGRDIIKFSGIFACSNEMSGYIRDELGIEVKLNLLYGDTDSIYLAGVEEITSFDIMCKIANLVGRKLTEAYGDFCKKTFNVDSHYLQIRAEEFARVFCMAPKKGGDEGAKKRYWYLPWGVLEGDRDWIEYTGDEIKVKGFETKRSDFAKVGRVVQKKVMEFITFDKEREYIRAYVDGIKGRIIGGKYPLEYLTFNVGLKNFDYYDAVKKGAPKTSWDEHVRAAWWGNEYFNQEWKPGDKVKVIYVKKSPLKFGNVYIKEKIDVIGVWNGRIPTGFVIDFDKVFEKQVQGTLTSILQTIGMTFNQLMSSTYVDSL